MRLVSSVLGALAALAAASASLPALADGDCAAFILQSDDEVEANDGLERCAAQGDREAQFALGVIYWSASDSSSPRSYGLEPGLTSAQMQAEGRRLIEAAANAGSASALNELGLAALEGTFGTDIDFALARTFLERAAAGGDQLAPFNMARLYYTGLGVAPSPTETERWLRLGAERGHRESMCSLAHLLIARQPPDLGEALRQRQAAERIGGRCGEWDLLHEMRR